MTIRAVAVLNSQVSAIASASYTIQVPPASLTAFGGSGQATQVANGFANALQVQALDASGLPAAGAVVSFVAPSSGPALTFSAATCTTDSTGLCSVTARANSSIGTYTVSASTAAFRAAFTLTNTGLHSYIVTVATDTTAGVAANCLDQATSSGLANASCSLRDALAAAALSATSTQPASITFAQNTPTTITLVNGTLNLPAYTTVQGATSGSGASLTNLITIDGNNTVTVFTQASGVQQSAINNLVVIHGFATQVGGAILSSGSLVVNNSTFIANRSAVSGGAISNKGGSLTIVGSTFTGNIAQTGYGGALDNYSGGTMTVSNSTFYGNGAASGGAIYNSRLGGTISTATLNASTLVGNMGDGIYNLGSMTISSSIVNSNTPNDCSGVACSPLWVYVLFAPVTPTPVDNGNITIAFSDSKGNTFSQTGTTGIFSTAASVASIFGPYFYYNHSGLDTTNITGQSFDTLLVISPLNGATLSPLNITNTGTSFTATQVNYPLLLSGNGNVSGQTATQIALGPLADNGGPTQTVLPLAGSTARCAVSPSIATGTDQRGQPRTAIVGGTTCQDAGAVQATGNP